MFKGYTLTICVEKWLCLFFVYNDIIMVLMILQWSVDRRRTDDMDIHHEKDKSLQPNKLTINNLSRNYCQEIINPEEAEFQLQ